VHSKGPSLEFILMDIRCLPICRITGLEIKCDFRSDLDGGMHENNECIGLRIEHLAVGGRGRSLLPKVSTPHRIQGPLAYQWKPSKGNLHASSSASSSTFIGLGEPTHRSSHPKLVDDAIRQKRCWHHSLLNV